MAGGEEAIRRRRQPPQLGRPTDRPRFGFVSDQALCLEIVEVLAHGHGGNAEAAGKAGGILRTVLLQAVDQDAAAALFRWNDVTGKHGIFLKFSLRSEEHTSELQSLMRSSYAVFCLKKQNRKIITDPY